MGKNRQNIVDGIEKVYKDATFNGNTNMEVLRARGSSDSLAGRLDGMNAQQVQNDTEISNLSSVIGDLGASSTFKGSDTRTNINSKTGVLIGDEWFDTTNNISIRWNGTSWVDVGSAIKVGSGSITPEKTTMFDTGKNLFNKLAVRKGGYTQYTDGVFVPLAGYNTFIIPVLPNTNYHQSTNEQYALFNSNLNSIGGRPGGAEDWNITTPSNAHFIGVNVKDAFLDSYQFELGRAETTYEPFKYMLKRQYLVEDESVYTINKANGDFKSFKEAISNLIEKTNDVNINVSVGEYDEIINGIRGDSNLSFIGKNKYTTRIINKSGDYYNSPLQIVGDFLIKDLSVIASHDNMVGTPDLPSYAYHGDYFGEGTSRFEEVIFESYQNSAVGIGTHANQKMIFKDCDIYTDTLYGAALYMHCSTQSAETNQKLVFDNCRILAKKGDALRIEDANILYGDGAGTDLEVEFINCHVWSEEKGLDCYSVAPAPIGVGTLAGNVKLSPKSHGNNLAVLNAY